MSKATITTKKLKKFSIVFAVIVFIILVVGSIVPVKISISEDIVNTQISRKLPKTIHKDIKLIGDKSIPIDIRIDHAVVTMSDHSSQVYADGVVSSKDKLIRFSVLSNIPSQNIKYINSLHAFYASPSSVEVHLNKRDIDRVLSPVEEEIEKKVSFLEKNKKEKDGFYKKIKNKIKEKFSKDKEEKLAEASITEKGVQVTISNNLLEMMKKKTSDYLRKGLNSYNREYLEKKIEDTISYIVRKKLETMPVYKLKEKSIDNKIKVFLSNVNTTLLRYNYRINS